MSNHHVFHVETTINHHQPPSFHGEVPQISGLGSFSGALPAFATWGEGSEPGQNIDPAGKPSAWAAGDVSMKKGGLNWFNYEKLGMSL